MKVSLETLPTSEAVLNVDYSWEELVKASDKAYRKLVQKVDIQGFRRGKAPRSILERRLGKEYIYQEALDDLMNETYRDALKEHSIVPLTQPELDAPVFEMGQPYHFTLKVPIMPTVELGDYRSLHFDRPTADVTSEEVEKELEQLRGRQVSWEVVERPAQLNDRVTVDLKLTSEDQVVSDLKDNPFELTDERHGLFKGMDEQIVGMSAGETKSFTTTIPEDYANEKLAGKTAEYEVTLHKVEVKEQPELDDAFAIQASNDQYQTIEDLRKGISDQLLENKRRKNRDELREQILDAVVDQAQMTIHPVMIEQEAHDMVHQMTHVLEQQKMSLDQYLMLIRKSEEEYEESLKPEAEKRVKQQLVLSEIIKQENIQVTPEEIESLYRLYAQMGQALPQTEEQIRSIASSLQREKAIEHLVKLTTDPDPDEAEVEDEEENPAAVLDTEEAQEHPGEVIDTEDTEIAAEEAARVAEEINQGEERTAE